VSLVLRGFLSIEVVSDAIAVRSWDATFDGAQLVRAETKP